VTALIRLWSSTAPELRPNGNFSSATAGTARRDQSPYQRDMDHAKITLVSAVPLDDGPFPRDYHFHRGQNPIVAMTFATDWLAAIGTITATVVLYDLDRRRGRESGKRHQARHVFGWAKPVAEGAAHGRSESRTSAMNRSVTSMSSWPPGRYSAGQQNTFTAPSCRPARRCQHGRA
jgi:hypothetical protein